MSKTKNLQVDLMLTKKELKHHSTLTPEAKKIYEIQKYNEKQALMIKSCALTTMLLETLDEMEEAGLVRSMLKKTANPFKVQLNLYLKRIFEVNTDPSGGNDYLASIIKHLEDGFEELRKITK